MDKVSKSVTELFRSCATMARVKEMKNLSRYVFGYIRGPRIDKIRYTHCLASCSAVRLNFELS